MQHPIRDEEKKRIIDYYLHGTRPQSVIATLVGRSEGTVSNVIQRFLDQAGKQNIDAIKNLVVAMNEAGIHADNCVRGFRMIQILSNMGIALDDEKDVSWIIKLESFIEDMYKAATSIGITGDQIVQYASQLLEVSKNELIDPAHVAEFCKSKQKQLGEAGKELKELERRKKKALDDCDVTEADLQQFRYVKKELQKYGRQIDDIPKLVKMLNNAEQLGHNASNMAAKVSELDSIEQKIKTDAGVCNSLEEEIAQSSKTCKSLKKEIESNSELLGELRELKDMGIGIEQLTILKDTIVGIVNLHELMSMPSAERNKGSEQRMTPKEAFRKFIADVEKHYDKLVGFDYAVEDATKLKVEIDELRAQRPALIENVNAVKQAAGQLQGAIEDFKSVVNTNLVPQAERLESFKKTIADATTEFKNISSVTVQDVRQKHAHYAETLGFMIKNLHFIIRSHNGQKFYVQELAEPVIYSLEAIIPRLDAEGYSDAHIKCEQALQALRHLTISSYRTW